MSSRLPETELANWAFLSPDNKWNALEKHIRPKQIAGSYEPFRAVFADTVNKQLPLFQEIEQEVSPWSEIERRLRAKCRRSNELLDMNLGIAKATHEYAQSERISALPIDVTSLALGVGHLYQFGLPLLMRYPDRVAGVFLDLRRSNGLSVKGRDWVFAAMHERFRTAYPDLATIDLEIWRYRNSDSRDVEAIRCIEIKLNYDELVSDARDTYAIYQAVLMGDKDSKRRAGGGYGPLFD